MSFNVSYVIQAIDKFTPVYRKINKELQKLSNDVQRDARKMAQSVKKAGETVTKSMDEAARGLRSSAKQVQDAFNIIDRSAEKSAQKVEQSVRKISRLERLSNFTNRLQTGLSSFGAEMSLYVTAPLALAGGAALKASMNYEKLETSFVSMLGGAKQAKDYMQQLAAATEDTPFKLKDMADSAKMLIGFGFSKEEAMKNLQVLKNAAAGTGTPIERMAYDYGEVLAQGRAYQTNIRMATTAGIPVMTELRRMMKNPDDPHAMEQLHKAIRSGQVTSTIFFEAFKRASERMYHDKAKIMRETTLSGAMTGLGNTFTNVFLKNLGDGITRTFKLTQHVNELARALKSLGERIPGFFANHPLATKVGVGGLAGLAALGPLAFVGAKILKTLRLAGSMVGLLVRGFFLLFTPEALVIGGLVALVGLMVTLYKKFKPVHDMFKLVGLILEDYFLSVFQNMLITFDVLKESLKWILDKLAPVTAFLGKWYEKGYNFLAKDAVDKATNTLEADVNRRKSLVTGQNLHTNQVNANQTVNVYANGQNRKPLIYKNTATQSSLNVKVGANAGAAHGY